jgi:DNA-binding beta-propeller fold protein YncE/mono/diheme cytochrome c family protein
MARGLLQISPRPRTTDIEENPMDLHRRTHLVLLVALLGGCAGSSSGAPPPGSDPRLGPGTRPPRPGTNVPWLDEVPPPPVDGEVVRFRRVVPTDERAARRAEAPPPAISGGTLRVSRDSAQAFVADPDRDRVSIVDIADRRILHTIALEPGDEPGRLVDDDMGGVHVVLRRGNAVASIDLASGSVLGRHAACVAPRGIAFDPVARMLHVACASGELVSLAEGSGEVVRRLSLGGQLRDVIVDGSTLLVTRFKSAELIAIDASGAVIETRTPPTTRAIFPEAEGRSILDSLEPRVAWRTVVSGTGGLLMMNQLARTGEIALPDEDKAESESAADPGTSPYGGAGGIQCTGVVQTELTAFNTTGGSGAAVRISATLPVDIAVSPYDGMVAVANAGASDPEQPQVTFEAVGDGSGDAADQFAPSPFGPSPMGPRAPTFAVQLHAGVDPLRDGPADEQSDCLATIDGVDMPGQAVAVAFTADGTLLVQSREPDELVIVEVESGYRGPTATIALGGQSVYDTGHEIFHRDPGGGVACASCHAEGGDDGHVWNFSGLGARRTQSVNVGLEGTAPFHWQGDMQDLSMIMEEVLVGRMGGVHQSVPRASALQDWLFALQPPPAPRSADDAAALRGRALFEGAAQCGSCHSGAKLTDNRSVDVGTGEPLQVPSLVGVAYRAPFIHDGCAATLRDRFDPACGGDQHGSTAGLTGAEIDDLVAYLESL